MYLVHIYPDTVRHTVRGTAARAWLDPIWAGRWQYTEGLSLALTLPDQMLSVICQSSPALARSDTSLPGDRHTPTLVGPS